MAIDLFQCWFCELRTSQPVELQQPGRAPRLFCSHRCIDGALRVERAEADSARLRSRLFKLRYEALHFRLAMRYERSLELSALYRKQDPLLSAKRRDRAHRAVRRMDLIGSIMLQRARAGRGD